MKKIFLFIMLLVMSLSLSSCFNNKSDDKTSEDPKTEIVTPDESTPEKTPEATPEQTPEQTPEVTTPEETTPEVTTPEETTPEETTPEVTTPEETTPEETTPEETTPEETTPEETTPEETTPEETTPEETTPEETTPEETTPEETTPEETTPEETTPDPDLAFEEFLKQSQNIDLDALNQMIPIPPFAPVEVPQLNVDLTNMIPEDRILTILQDVMPMFSNATLVKRGNEIFLVDHAQGSAFKIDLDKLSAAINADLANYVPQETPQLPTIPEGTQFTDLVNMLLAQLPTTEPITIEQIVPLLSFSIEDFTKAEDGTYMLNKATIVKKIIDAAQLVGATLDEAQVEAMLEGADVLEFGIRYEEAFAGFRIHVLVNDPQDKDAKYLEFLVDLNLAAGTFDANIVIPQERPQFQAVDTPVETPTSQDLRSQITVRVKANFALEPALHMSYSYGNVSLSQEGKISVKDEYINELHVTVGLNKINVNYKSLSTANPELYTANTDPQYNVDMEINATLTKKDDVYSLEATYAEDGNEAISLTATLDMSNKAKVVANGSLLISMLDIYEISFDSEKTQNSFNLNVDMKLNDEVTNTITVEAKNEGTTKSLMVQATSINRLIQLDLVNSDEEQSITLKDAIIYKNGETQVEDIDYAFSFVVHKNLELNAVDEISAVYTQANGDYFSVYGAVLTLAPNEYNLTVQSSEVRVVEGVETETILMEVTANLTITPEGVNLVVEYGDGTNVMMSATASLTITPESYGLVYEIKSGDMVMYSGNATLTMDNVNGLGKLVFSSTDNTQGEPVEKNITTEVKLNDGKVEIPADEACIDLTDMVIALYRGYLYGDEALNKTASDFSIALKNKLYPVASGEHKTSIIGTKMTMTLDETDQMNLNVKLTANEGYKVEDFTSEDYAKFIEEVTGLQVVGTLELSTDEFGNDVFMLSNREFSLKAAMISLL